MTLSSISHTSGCTGAPLSVYRSSEELAFLWAYQLQLLAPTRRRLARRPLVLSLPNLYHGTAVPVPSLGKVFTGGVTDDLLLGDLIALVRRRFRIPGHDERISMVTGLVHQLLFLTHALLERGVDPRELGVQSLILVGGYAPPARRAYLADAWGATVIDRFSLTESVGGAARCLACGYFHLDPNVIGEVLHPDRDAPLETGVGRLVLTQLYPFVQLQPMLRYDTGDLVRRVPSDCLGALTFEFAGKAANCIADRRGGTTAWLVLSAPLHDALDPIPDLARVEQFRGVHGTRDPSVGSLPRYTLTTDEPRPGLLRLRLALELRYGPHYYPARTAELSARLRAALVAAHPALAAGLASGRVELAISYAGPGELGAAGILKV